ncbi:non-ribosomal peptide synthetase [Kordia zhangzhouensis]|uniref:non-ribosomal peptide synthetase n=1 Tax=Kordia zhangzhouensis TaxID=1620405 RepID=UPI0006298BEC|nr:non-ribosomal peptide synthetase [Kordia zhangzhouensis]
MKLTLPQQDIYFEQLVYPNEPIYNIGADIRIDGQVNYDILNQAYIALINQHDAYRSILKGDLLSTAIEILPSYNTALEYVDFSSDPQPEKAAANFMQADFKEAFDITSEKVLFKFVLIKVTETSYHLYSKYHHIITDGWGTSVMFQRLVKNYNELIEFGKITSDYPFTYEEFVKDDEAYQTSEAFENDKAYWTDKFKSLPNTLFQRKNPKARTNKSNRKTLVLTRSFYNTLNEVSKTCKATTLHTILAALNVYFARKHQNNDIVIGLPVLNRSSAKFKKTVGLFMGISALRMQVNFEDSFETLVQQIRQQLRQDYRYQRFPLGKLVQELELFHEKEGLFNITLSYEKQNYADHFANTHTEVIPMTHGAERVALALYIREFDETEDVRIDFDYNTNYFSEEEITQVVHHIETLLTSIVANPTKKLTAYTYLSKEEKETLAAFNDTKIALPKSKTFLDVFADNSEDYTNKIAVKDGEKTYTYDALEITSNAIAQALQKQQIAIDNTPIAIMMDRSADMVAVLLGVMKAGSAYIPLDPSFPKERLEYIIEHSGVHGIIGDVKYKGVLNSRATFIDAKEVLTAKNTGEVLQEVTPEDSAYIIYTSGSTGNPKGVEIGHKSLFNFLSSMIDRPEIKQTDTLFSVTTISFDISILELFAPLMAGATLYVANNETLSNPTEIAKAIQEVQPTILQATPSFYQMLFNDGWTGDKRLKILCGGDVLGTALAEKLLHTCDSLWNMYGPTETTIWSSVKHIQNPAEATNIGTPIYNTEFFILDEAMQMQPIGAAGAIYIGGDGLAKGYYKNEELTAERFIKNPFNPNTRLYNTGDLGKWTKEGEIEFLGRNDFQVKIRGFRIELGDIETKLNAISGIKDAVVVKKSIQEEAMLVGYVMMDASAEFDAKTITNALRNQLPAYMIPNAIVPVDDFPLTPNKKVNRKALAEKSLEVASSLQSDNKAMTATEEKIYQFFKQILKINDDFSIDSSFFMLGGHSLNAVRLIGLIENEFGCRLTLRDMFDRPDVRSIAHQLDSKECDERQMIVPVETQEFYPVTFPQYAIWLASLQAEKSIAYNMFSAYEVQGKIDKHIMETAFKGLVKKFEILRTNFVEHDGHAYQKVKAFENVQFKVDEVQTTLTNYEETLKKYTNKEFDLANDLLIKIAIFNIEGQADRLVFSTHHVIMDGWSLELMIQETTNRYRTILAGETYQEETLSFQFKDFVVWQNQKEQDNLAINKKFWSEYISDYQWKQLVPYDTEYAEAHYKGEFYHFRWDREFMDALNTLAVQNKVTLHTLLMGTYNTLLYKMYGQDDLCVGTINSGRTFSELNKHLGMFVKTLPLRTHIQPETSYASFLQQMHENLMNVDSHQDVPEEVLNTLRFEAIMVLQNQTFNYKEINITEDLKLVSKPAIAEFNRLPMLIDFSVDTEAIQGCVLYDTSKYHRETIEILMLKFEKLLQQILTNVHASIHEYDISLEFEQQEVVDIDFNF